MKLVGSKDSITFTVSMPDGYIGAVSGETQVERQKGKLQSPNCQTLQVHAGKLTAGTQSHGGLV